MVVLAHVGHVDLQVPLVVLVKPEQQVVMDVPDLQDQEDQAEFLVTQVQWESQDPGDHVDLQDLVVRPVKLEAWDLQDLLVHPDHPDHEDPEEKVESVVQVEKQVLMDLVDHVDLAAHLDLLVRVVKPEVLDLLDPEGDGVSADHLDLLAKRVV